MSSQNETNKTPEAEEIIRESLYVTTTGVQEDQRLKLQNRVLDAFDYDVYKETCWNLGDSLTMLDVGCGTGDMLIPKLRAFHITRFLGIDLVKKQIEKAEAKYASENIAFECMNVESVSFEANLQAAMDKLGIEKFDVIDVSMVLLHLADPQNVLRVLRKFLGEKGRIIVRDIDDGLNFAYPDVDGLFKHMYQIALRDDCAGNRYTGRKIYFYLSNAGYRNISLKRQGLSTAGWDEDMKDTFYDMGFRLFGEHARRLYAENPDDPQRKADVDWLNEHASTLQQTYNEPNFMTSLGFMTYVASK